VRSILTLAMCLIAHVAVADEAARLRVVDVPRNGSQFLGQRITVTGCGFTKATATHVNCAPVSSNTGGPIVLLSTTNMANDVFDRILRHCSPGTGAPAARCSGSATGILDRVGGDWQLSDVVVSWDELHN
jgi:hypothetical protein